MEMRREEEMNLIKEFFSKANIDLEKFPFEEDEEIETKNGMYPTTNYQLNYDQINATAKYNNGPNTDVYLFINCLPENFDAGRVFTVHLNKGGDDYFSVELSLRHHTRNKIPIFMDSIAQENFVEELSQVKFYREKKDRSHTGCVRLRFGNAFFLFPYKVILN